MNNPSDNQHGDTFNHHITSHNQPNSKITKSQQKFSHKKNSSGANDLFKFMFKPQTANCQKIQGKRCFSNHKSAVSNDSPQHFKLTHTIVVGKGISNNFGQKILKTQVDRQNQKQRSQSINFYGNKNYFNISNQTQNENNSHKDFLPQYTNIIKTHSNPFHVKNTKCSKFLDQNFNKYLGQNYPLLGFERNQQGRKINNDERKNIITQKIKAREKLMSQIDSNDNQKRQTYSEWKIKTERISRRSSKSKNSQASNHSDRNSQLFILKSKVRKQRNQMANELNKQSGTYLQKDGVGSLHQYQTHSHELVDQKGFRSTASSIRPCTCDANDLSDNRLISKLGRLQKNRHNKTKTISFQKNVTLQKGEDMVSKLELWQSYINPSNQNFRRKIIQRQAQLQKLRQQ